MTLPERQTPLLRDIADFVSGEKSLNTDLRLAHQFKDDLKSTLFEYCPTLHLEPGSVQRVSQPHHTPVVYFDTHVGKIAACVRGVVLTNPDKLDSYQILNLGLYLQRIGDEKLNRKYVGKIVEIELLSDENEIIQDTLPPIDEIRQGLVILPFIRARLEEKSNSGSIQRFVTTA